MNLLAIFMVKAAIYLIVLFLVYSILLSRDTTYARNRAFILFSLVTAFILPFIGFQTSRPLNIQLFGKLLTEVFVTPASVSSEKFHLAFSTTNLLQFIYSLYVIIVILCIFKLIIDLFNLMFLILRNRDQESRIIRFNTFNTSGFSAMGYIFINSRLSAEDSDDIIRHEQNHLNQNHFIDIILIELIKSVQWFNPAVYLFDRSLRAIHEYQADRKCLNSGIPIVNYQHLLLSQVFKSKAFNLTNSFSNPSLIKKRMVMMSKKPTASIANLKLIAVFPVLFIIFLAISAYREFPVFPVKQSLQLKDIQNSSSPDIVSALQDKAPDLTQGLSEEPFVAVEEMPMFPGGDIALLKYIAVNTIYPQNAQKQDIQGKVVVRFCITAQGGISLIHVIQGVSPDLDAEAIRVVRSLPAFKPGKQDGKPVPVWYMVPIAFTLK